MPPICTSTCSFSAATTLPWSLSVFPGTPIASSSLLPDSHVAVHSQVSLTDFTTIKQHFSGFLVLNLIDYTPPFLPPPFMQCCLQHSSRGGGVDPRANFLLLLEHNCDFDSCHSLTCRSCFDWQLFEKSLTVPYPSPCKQVPWTSVSVNPMNERLCPDVETVCLFRMMREVAYSPEG